MASSTITLTLDGSPTIREFSTALRALQELLRGIEESVDANDESGIEWVVEGLEASSAIATFRGEAADVDIVARVASAYLEVGRLANDPASEEFMRLPKAIRRPLDQLTGIINGRVSRLRFETADDDIAVQAPLRRYMPVVARDMPGAFGAVEGRIQTLSSRNALRFTLYDVLWDRAVGCYVTDSQRDLVEGLWDRLAVVEGWVSRDAESGRPTSVRRIRRITPVDVAEEGAWRRARGAASGPERAEVYIRQVRDVL